MTLTVTSLSNIKLSQLELSQAYDYDDAVDRFGSKAYQLYILSKLVHV